MPTPITARQHLRPAALALLAGTALALSALPSLAQPTPLPAPAAPAPAPVPPATPPAAVPPAAVPAAAKPAQPNQPAPAEPTADQLIPIRKITLYRSGVGYFERSGQLTGNSDLQLRFKTEQINDILKSMILLDLSGGRIESVSYGSKEPLGKRLASFGINIAANPGIPELLSQLRGALIKITVAGEPISGTILGVEERLAAAPKDKDPVRVPHVNLVTESGIRSIAIPDIGTFEIQDKELAAELNKALAALAEYRADRTKTVELRFAGEGDRRVVVAYVHEMPVWKTSYRLVLPEPAASGQDADKLMFQGWAIVENTTDQDWAGVQLGLVSGRPVSFQMDLYEPLYSARPMIPVPTIPGVAPRIFALGVDQQQLAEADAAGRSDESMFSNVMQSQKSTNSPRPREMAVGSRAPAAAPAYASASSGDYEALRASAMSDYAARPAASGVSVGEVFQFQVNAPVSIERQKSAMIPIMSGQISGRRVSIFNAADGSQFPMRGVELTNDSGQPLLPGPISVFDGAAYAGDAQIGQIPKADKRFLAYALDLDVAVLTKADSAATITKLVINRGTIVQSIRDRLTTTYELANKDAARPRNLILEHPISPGFELVETIKPTEQAQDLYRFTLDLEPAKAKRFTVAQERVRAESMGITSLNLETLMQYRRDGKASEAVVKAFQDAATRQAAMAQTERTLAQLGSRIDEIAKDQSRIRENMGAIDRNSQLYASYVARLTRQETDLDQLREQRSTQQTQLDQQRQDLAQFLTTLSAQ